MPLNNTFVTLVESDTERRVSTEDRNQCNSAKLKNRVCTPAKSAFPESSFRMLFSSSFLGKWILQVDVKSRGKTDATYIDFLFLVM